MTQATTAETLKNASAKEREDIKAAGKNVTSTTGLPYPTVDGLDVKNKTVLLRIDGNVPLDANQKIADDSRLRAVAGTILELRQKGAKLVLMSHLGRPRGERVFECSLKPVSDHLSTMLNMNIRFLRDCIGTEVEEALEDMESGDVTMLENLRFHVGEETDDNTFAKSLAKLAGNNGVYVNDAFGASHRAHASLHAITRYIQTKAIGRVMEEEISTLNRLMDAPSRPLLVMIGGAKISTKIGVLRTMATRAEQMMIGGAMANTFIAALGYPTGKSLFEPEHVGLAREVLTCAGVTGCRVLLPEDFVVASEFKENATTRILPKDGLQDGDMALDIGPRTLEIWKRLAGEAGTVLWNGPMGAFETKPFHAGTVAMAQAVAASGSFSVAGGGDTIAALNQADVSNDIGYISTGGGAMLEFLEGTELPALEVLRS